jgi:alpha-galactosidase/6-phospho-beta-glucosidase family protein
MKTLRISDETHRKLTATLGTLMAQTGKLQTYSDAIEALLNCSITLQPELLAGVERYINENKQQGYITREEFIAEAIRFLLRLKSKEYKYIEVSKEKYEKLNKTLKEMNMPYYNATEFIEDQIDKALTRYEEYLEETEKQEERL